MLKDAVAVIDIGSYKLTALVGENGVNSNFTIRAIEQIEHEAFDDGVLNEKALYNAVVTSFNKILSATKANIDRVYVGLSGEFLRVTNRQHSTFYNRIKRIRPKDLTSFFDDCEKSLTLGDYEVISRDLVCAYIDGSRPVSNPIGVKTKSLSGYITFTASKSALLNKIRAILKTLNVSDVRFISVPLAEGRLLFTDEERLSTQILLDVGYLSTSLTVLNGNGALFHSDFPVGGGYVTAYLYDGLDVDFDVAERVKRKMNLSIVSSSGNYDLVFGDMLYSFPINKVNEIGRNVLDQIAEQFDRIISQSGVRLPHNVSVSLTGGGISYIRGGAEYLSSRIEMPVNVVCPKISYLSKPDESSVLSTLNFALNEKSY